MDRDHDYFHGELCIAPGILYTHGYSWENDVCSPEVIEDVFWTLAQIARGSVPVRVEIDSLFAQVCSQLQRAVYLDILIGFHGGSLLPRDSQTACINYLDRTVNRALIKNIFQNLLTSLEWHTHVRFSGRPKLHYMSLGTVSARSSRVFTIERYSS